MNITSRLSKAFSLTELMVTLAIVSLISVVAIPVLTKYIAQSKVSDAIQAAANLQSSIGVKIADKESTTNSGVGVTLPDTLGRYVASFSVSDNGTISITTTASANSVSLNLTPSFNSTTQAISWTCAVTSSTFNEYVPSNCRI